MTLENYTDESRGIVNSSRAARPAETPLETWRYLRRDTGAKFHLILTVVFLFFGIGWIVDKGYYILGGICTGIGAGLLWLMWRMLRSQRRVYQHGLLVPGILVGLNPPRILAAANMSSRGGPQRAAIKLTSENNLPKDYNAIGAELPCVAYFHAGPSEDHWGDFFPQPLCIGCSDEKLLADRKSRIDPGEFAGLKLLVAQGKIPAETRQVVFLDPPAPPPPPAAPV